MALPKIVADLETSLATKIAVGGTTGTLVSNIDDDGVTLADGEYYFTIDGNNSAKEHIRCTKTGTALSSIYSYSRQGVATSGTVREHRVGAKVIMTDYATYKNYFEAAVITGPGTSTNGNIVTWTGVAGAVLGTGLALDTDLSSVSASDDSVPSAKATKTALDLKSPLISPAFTTPNLGTPSAGTLTNCTGLPVNGIVDDTTSALGVGTLELGHASDTTISRVSAGVIAVEGVTIPSVSSTSTLTNKRITQRVVTTTDDATAVIDVDVTDTYELSAVANATTFSTTGTPTDGQKLIIRFKDAGAGKGLTWDSVFVAIGTTLPTTTIAGKWHYVGCQYNSAAGKWHAIAVGVQA